MFSRILLLLSCAGALLAQSSIQTTSLTASSADCTTAGSCATLTLATNSAVVGVQITGTWSATLQFEGTMDNATWFSVNAFDPTAYTMTTSAAANGDWQIGVAGMSKVRVRASAFVSGPIVVNLRSSSTGVVGGNIPNLIAGDANNNAAMVGPAAKTVTFTNLNGTGTVYDISNYSLASVQITANAGTVTWQISNNNSNWVGTLGEDISLTNLQRTSTTASSGIFTIKNLGHYFRLSTTANASGVIMFKTLPQMQTSVFSQIGNANTGADGQNNTSLMTVSAPSSQNGYLGIYPYIFNGTSWDRQVTCNQSVTINPSTATTTLLIAVNASKTHYVCSIEITNTAANTAKVVAGTQVTNPCDTGTVTLTNTYGFGASATNYFAGGTMGYLFKGTATNQQMCVTTSAANSIFITVHYADLS